MSERANAAYGSPRRPIGIWRALKGVWVLIGEKNLNLIASGIGFYGLLATFPAIAALIALWGFVADPALVAAQVSEFTTLLPDEVATLLTARVTELVAADSTTLGWAGLVSIAIALWSTRAGIAALVVGLNAVYGERNRGGLRHMMVAFGLTGSLIVLALACFAALVVAPIALAFLPVGPFLSFIAEVLRWCVAISTVLLALGLVYRYAPNRRGVARAGWITPGAIAATILWALATWAFTVYLQNFANYNKVYGSLGAVIVMLLWLYISAFVCLLGAALNAELELQQKADTTRGPAKPMGQRGAFVADNTSRNFENADG
ncbi:membrane protein [Roseovarius nanhaiticus]|uniref:Membrane protein n=1 Tax=Roseovarius nanhaiticus TaxID=573024 RepID=A0A1N7H0N4_9RHOB|nr:YihY/virulence factor BrkB family protein [Roseovarius nanhaiticus]SEL17215.1 membrane protein [Roseovarius nanhaiticus]SIS18382.1 membrane protein [Roseovarius nanhaiticus]